ncbi:MAG: hypothetical protein K9I95_05175 [Flavobacteriaceae bacterium]|nr:hypothetical protein [Flavobacteriaceae bacterium]
MRKITLLLIYILTLSIVGCKENRQKTPFELRMELQMEENSNPLQYLKLENISMQRNKIKEAGLFSSAKYDGYLITGQVKNTASIAKYKDLKITVELYSQTKTLIESKSFIIYEYYEPNSTKDFSLKIDAPNTMKNFGTFVLGASPTYE